MREAPCCQQGLRALISRKLGRCPRCMRASAFGTLAGWATFAATYVVWPHPTLLALGLLVTVSFTLLLLAHLVAVMVRVASLHDAVHAGHSAGVPAEFSVGRRAVLLRLGRAALWTAAFGFGLFRMPREAGAEQANPCKGERAIAHPLAPLTVCAKDAADAAKKTEPLFRKDAKAFGNNFCRLFNFCKFRCMEKGVGIDIVCSKIRDDDCKNPHDDFFGCDATVTKVVCGC